MTGGVDPARLPSGAAPDLFSAADSGCGPRLGDVRGRLGAVARARAGARRACPPELDGLRIAHLSDFHLGVPSRGAHAVERAVDWAAERKPDLVVITGDLLTHPRGEPRLRELVARLPLPAFAVLGNHDVAVSRDPQARASNLRALEPATLLRDDGVLLELRGKTRLDRGDAPAPRRARRGEDRPELADARRRPANPALPLPARVRSCRARTAFDLVLAGHMHDGQITVPYPGGKLRLAHPSARYQRGALSQPRRRAARLAGARHDLRSVSLRGEARGDGAGATFGVDGRASLDLGRHPRAVRGRRCP